MKSNLTLILTTKGRDAFTIRFLEYANYISLKYPIYIADGEPKEHIKKKILNRKNYPNIKYDYFEYNGINYKEFYKKLVDSLSSIKTDYVMFIDNDDFVLNDAMGKTIDFLDKNKDYVGASGKIGWCYTKDYPLSQNYLYGHFKFYNNCDGYNPVSYSNKSSFDRINKATQNYNSLWYSMFRKSSLLLVAKENANLNFKTLYSSEIFFYLRIISLGKIYFDKNITTYIRQLGTSEGGDQNEKLYQKKMDWLDSVLDGVIYNDMNKII